MATDVSSHGSGLLLGMLHMPTLVSTTAGDSPVMLSAAAAAAEAYSQGAPGATSSGTDSHMDAVHADAAAAQFLESQAGLSLETQEAALNQLKKACKAAKSAPKKRPGQKKQQLVCKVDGCGAHLGAAKAYYQRHKVCAVHLSAMCSKVNGIESRFCQQCGKFQPLEDFDADKRSCRARLKRHNNRRREQRHNKSYEFALELRCQAAAQLLGMTEDDDSGHYEPYYAQQGLHVPYGTARFSAQYQPHQFGLAAGFTPNHPVSNMPNMAAAAAAAAMLVAKQQQQQYQYQQQQQQQQEQFEQQQQQYQQQQYEQQYEQYEQQPFEQQQQQFEQQPYEQQQYEQQQPGGPGGMVSRWPGLECATTTANNSPKHSRGNAAGDPSGSAGGVLSEGTTGPAQHSSPGLSPSAAAVAAAAAAATAAAGAAGTPTSRRPGGVRRVSANRALEALRTLNSTHSTESDWEEDSEDGGGGRSPQGWQHTHPQRRGAPGQPGMQRLQGSRLKASDSRVAVGFPGSSGVAAPAGSSGIAAELVPHLGHLLPSHMLDTTPRASQGPSQSAAGFRSGSTSQGGLSHLNPGSTTIVQQQQWQAGGMMEGLAPHQHNQQDPQQQQHWGSAYDSSCGGGASGGGASYDNSYVQQQGQHISSAGGCSGTMQQANNASMQYSAPAGLCYQSRSNSPAVSTGGTAVGVAAGPGPSLLGPGPRSGSLHAGSQMQGGAMHPQWSMPAEAASPQEFYAAGSSGAPMHLQELLLQHPIDPHQLLTSMQQACQQQQQGQGGGEAAAFGSMQAHELQQVLEGLMPPGMATGGLSSGHDMAAMAAAGPVSAAPCSGGDPAAAGIMAESGPAAGHMPGPTGPQQCAGSTGMQLDGFQQQYGSPPEHNSGCANALDGFQGTPGSAQCTTQQPPGMYLPASHGMGAAAAAGLSSSRQLSPQVSMTAAAAAAAAAIACCGFASAAMQHGQQLGMEHAEHDAMQMQQLLPHAEQHQHHPCGSPEVPPHCSDEAAAAAAQLAAAAAAATAAAAAVPHTAGSPEEYSPGVEAAGGMLLGALDPSGLQHLRADSQGTSALREGLAGVSLGSGHWQVQQRHLQAQDMDMHDDPSMQQLQEVAGGSACAEQVVDIDTQQEQHMLQQQSPCAEFDSADTAAAAATFEAQLAACCGNRDSQEAVFRAWLDALLPNQGEQQAQQQPAQQGEGSPLNQPSRQDGQQAAPASPQEFDGLMYQQQQGEADAHQQPGLVADLQAEYDDDVDAAAAALHLAAQRAVEQGIGQEGSDALNPEEDFRELLDLLLDA